LTAGVRDDGHSAVAIAVCGGGGGEHAGESRDDGIYKF
jgi:hypothetical protein